MHESRTVADLLARVECEVDHGRDRVTRIRLRVGPLSPIGPVALCEGLRQRTLLDWGYSPEVAVEETGDPGAPGAAAVRLVSVTLGTGGR